MRATRHTHPKPRHFSWHDPRNLSVECQPPRPATHGRCRHQVWDACWNYTRIQNRATSTDPTAECIRQKMSTVQTPQLSQKIAQMGCQIAKTGFPYDKTVWFKHFRNFKTEKVKVIFLPVFPYWQHYQSTSSTTETLITELMMPLGTSHQQWYRPSG